MTPVLSVIRIQEIRRVRRKERFYETLCGALLASDQTKFNVW